MAAVELIPGVLPRLASVVVKGAGRGAARLGWRTASLEPTAQLTEQLAEVPPGVYCGWAALGPCTKGLGSAHADEVFQAAVTVGVDPMYRGNEPMFNKAAEAHLLHDFGDEDFHGSDIRVVLAGFLRHELQFNLNDDTDPLEMLRAAVSLDVQNAREALGEQEFAAVLEEHRPFLRGEVDL